MLFALRDALRFYWRASAGYRLCPWRSPYLRWRMETFTGRPAESLRLVDFLRLAFAERRQVGRFFRWVGELREIAESTAA